MAKVGNLPNAPQTKALIEEIRKNKDTYRRFIDRYDLRSEVQRALIATLKEGTIYLTDRWYHGFCSLGSGLISNE